MKTVADFDNEFQAELAAGLLASEGIPSQIFNRLALRNISTEAIRPDLRPYIVVLDDDYDRAVELLAAEYSEVTAGPEELNE